MKTLTDLYKNPSNIVSFESIKITLQNFHLPYRTLFKESSSIKISFINKDKRKTKIGTEIMNEIIKLEKDLKLYFHRAEITISDNSISIDVN